jgi:diketogulonate reductase-like aldo/keto reductase
MWRCGDEIATDQVLYNLKRRGIEWDLLPWCCKRDLPVMAYSPIERGSMLQNPQLKSVASRHGATPAQVALAWLLQHEGTVVIPKASSEAPYARTAWPWILRLPKRIWRNLTALSRRRARKWHSK